MGVSGPDLDQRMKAALADLPAPLSAAAERRLMASADELLARRRAQLSSSREARATRSRWLRGLLSSGAAPARRLGEALEFLALHPAAQVATLVALASLVILLQAQHRGGRRLTFSDLPDFPRFNSAPAAYDALWATERKALDQEVKDAHENTRGGI